MIKTTNLKNTSVAWMPEIPSNWDLMRGKFLFKSRKVINDKMQCNDRLGLTLRGVIDRFEGDGVGLNPNDLRTYQIFNENELVFKLIDLENKNTSRVGFVHKRGIMSSAYIRVMNNANVNMRYFYYQYYNLYQRFIFNMIGQGVRATMSSSDLLNIPVAIPPLEVQNRIVAYLDKKNNKIDQFIRNKERLIELAIENKEKEIWKIVSGKNLKANKVKNSSIKCIGEIPDSWDVKNLNYISNVVLGKMLCNENKGNYKLKPYLKSKNIGWESVIVNEVDEMWYSKNEMKTYRIHKNDLLVSEGGEVGKTCIWNDEIKECYIQNSVHKITFKKNMNPIFFLYYLYTLGKSSYFKSIVNQVSIGHLTREKLVKVKCIVPPFEIQNNLVEQILEQIELANTIIFKAQKELFKIEEYREALITDLVTGKRSVPEPQRI